MHWCVRRIVSITASFFAAACGAPAGDPASGSDCELGAEICSSQRILGTGCLEGFLGGPDRLVVSFPNETHTESRVEVWSSDGGTKAPALSGVVTPLVDRSVGLAEVRKEGRLASLRIWDPVGNRSVFVADDLLVPSFGRPPQFGVCGSKVWYWASTIRADGNCAMIRVADLSAPEEEVLDLGYGCHNGQEKLAAFSSDCGQIVFPTHHFDLAHHDLLTGVTTPLPGHPKPNWTYLFSDDGRTVAYSALVRSEDDGEDEQRLLVVHGSPPAVRTVATGVNGFRLSPDGGSVAFRSKRGETPEQTGLAESELFVGRGDADPLLLDSHAFWSGAAVFSPDGSKVAWQRKGETSESPILLVRDLDTGRTWEIDEGGRDWGLLFAKVPPGATPGEIADALTTDPSPRFSASGRTLVYFIVEDGDVPQVSVRSFDLDSGERVVHFTGERLPLVKTAGEWLAFLVNGDGLFLARLGEDRPARRLTSRAVWMFSLEPDALAYGAVAKFDEDVVFVPLSRDRPRRPIFEE